MSGTPSARIADVEKPTVTPRDRRLAADERLVLVTDGVTERRNEGGSTFRIARSRKPVVEQVQNATAAATAMAILQALTDCRKELLEDGTVLVLRVAEVESFVKPPAGVNDLCWGVRTAAGGNGCDNERKERKMAVDRGRRGVIGGISLGGILVIIGIIVAIVWSLWLGIIIAVIGLVAFGGFARGKWY